MGLGLGRTRGPGHRPFTLFGPRGGAVSQHDNGDHSCLGSGRSSPSETASPEQCGGPERCGRCMVMPGPRRRHRVGHVRSRPFGSSRWDPDRNRPGLYGSGVRVAAPTPDRRRVAPQGRQSQRGPDVRHRPEQRVRQHLQSRAIASIPAGSPSSRTSTPRASASPTRPSSRTSFTSWSTTPNTVTLHVRPGVVFSNGDPVDANAIKDEPALQPARAPC